MDTVEYDFAQLSAGLLEQAERSPDGRAIQRLDFRHSTLRLMAIGFTKGAVLPEHENPGEAVLQVLHGAIVLTSDAPMTANGRELQGGQTIEAQPGLLVRIPDARHRVEALEPSVILLTAVSLPSGHAH